MEVERRSSSGASSSPEFEFWMVHNPSCPPPDMLTADELFVDGVLLPLHLLSLPRSSDPPAPHPIPSPPAHPPPPPIPPSSILSSATPTSVSRRWKDLFKVAAGDKQAEDHKEKEKKKQKNPKTSAAASASAADININLNIWPFSRSRSAGNSAATRLRSSIAGRKVSSAPCSRSNSRGDSTAAAAAAAAASVAGGRKWPASPGRGGVHLGRSSPVWQPRRVGVGPIEKSRKPVPASAGGGGGVRVLNLNVNSCIGHRNQLGAGGNDSHGVTGSARTVEGSDSNGSLFSFMGLFSKKVH